MNHHSHAIAGPLRGPGCHSPRLQWGRRPCLPLLRLHAAALLLLALAAPAQAQRYGDVQVTLEARPQGETTHGYAEYAFLVRNQSPERTHRVTLTMPRDSYGGGHRVERITRTVEVGPESSARISLFHPPLPIMGSGIQVSIDGRRQRQAISGASFQHMSDLSSGMPRPPSGTGAPAFGAVLVSRTLNHADLQASYEEAFPPAGSGSGASAYGFPGGPSGDSFIQADRPVTAWSENWLAYSAYDGIVLHADDVDQLASATRRAVESYVEVGGTLLVLGDGPLPEAWQRFPAGDSTYHMGFGSVIALPDADAAEWTESRWRTLRDAFASTARPWGGTLDAAAANRAFPVVDDLGVPVRGLFALMLVFAILIGPVNLFVLKRTGRRMWMLWTVPAISLVFCGAVFAYNLAAEGWTAHSRTQLITVLDQPARRAASIGWTACYAPLTPRDGLRFGYDTELSPQVELDRFGGGSGRGRIIDWTADQHLASGWVAARVPAHFLVRRAHTERQRIDFTPSEDGAVTATNGLRAAVRELRYTDPDGRTWTADAIPAGGTATLLAEDEPPGAEFTLDDARGLYASNWESMFRNDPSLNGRRPAPGTYLAVTDSPAFLDSGLPGAAAVDGPSLLFGITERAP